MRLVFAAVLLLPLAAAALPLPDPPVLAADAYILVDHDSGQVLAAKEPDRRVQPASLTKVMTVYIAFDEMRQERVEPTDLALISEKAWRRGMDSRESRMFIEVGKRVAVQDLLRGIIVQSGNDASIALAEHLAGSEETFAGLMNRYAQKLGLSNTHFTNATGVPEPGMHTTAHDMAVLSRALIRDFPERYALFKEKEFVFNKIRQPNRNRLLWRDPSVDGIKTGHAEEPGYHLAASAEREGRRLISVVLGTAGESARADASLALLTYGFRFFENVPAAQAQAPLVSIRAWKGENKELALGVAQPVIVTVPHGAGARLEIAPKVQEPVFAPIEAGQVLGTLTISLDGKVLREEPLVALAALPQGGWWRRLVDAITLWLQQWF